MPLLDQYERPIDLSKLREEEAGPTVTGVRQVVTGHPAQGLTPVRLARILREAEEGDATRYLELAEEMEEKDLHYLAVLGNRKRAVAQLEITVEPASDSADDEANAQLVRDFLARDELEDELCDILDAIGKGYSVTEIIWEMSERQWMPQRLEWRYPQWFETDREDGRTLRLRDIEGPRDLSPFKYITHLHKAKSGLPIRGGLARPVAWAYLFKNYDIKDWVAFAEIYGQPLRLGKYGPGATPEDKATLLRAVRSISTDAAAIIPASMEIEFVEAKLTGNIDLYERLAEFFDKQISKGVLGQTLTTEVGSSGSYAASKTHNEVREDIERSDARQLAGSLNRDLGRPIVDLNRGPQKAYPKIKIGRQEQTNVEELSDSLAKLVPLGLRVSATEVRGKIGMEEPQGDDELLGRPETPAPAEGEPGQAEASARRCPGCGTVHAAARGKPRYPADDLADAMEAASGEAMDEMIAVIGRLVEESADMAELSERLLEIYPEISATDLGETLAKALTLAELKGRADIADRD